MPQPPMVVVPFLTTMTTLIKLKYTIRFPKKPESMKKCSKVLLQLN